MWVNEDKFTFNKDKKILIKQSTKNHEKNVRTRFISLIEAEKIQLLDSVTDWLEDRHIKYRVASLLRTTI